MIPGGTSYAKSRLLDGGDYLGTRVCGCGGAAARGAIQHHHIQTQYPADLAVSAATGVCKLEGCPAYGAHLVRDHRATADRT